MTAPPEAVKSANPPNATVSYLLRGDEAGFRNYRKEADSPLNRAGITWAKACELAPAKLGKKPTRMQRAVGAGISVYVSHSPDPKNRQAHRAGRPLGTALAMLDGGKIRVQSVLSADTFDDLIYYLRGVVRMMREQQIQFDYTQLIWDLALWQNPEKQQDVTARWGKDFYLHGLRGPRT